MSKLAKKDSIYAMLLGTNGTGKSTLLRKIADAAVSRKRVLIIPSNQAEPTFKDVPLIKPEQLATFTGMKKIMCYEEDHFAFVARWIQDAVIITDDFRNYLPRPQMNPYVRKMFIDRRHKRLDIYMAAHGFTQVPPELFTWCDFIFMFRTKDNPHRAKAKFLDYQRVLDTQAAKSNPYHFKIIENG
jgi:hypothetical protein